MARILQILGIAAATLIPTTVSLASFTPLSSNSPIYKVGIPSSSSISASSTGSIYIQITAPTSYQWVGFGIGEQMAGARIFVMYADGNGNVTLSARAGGRGQVQPLLDENLQSGVELLAGSGIVDGNMVANFKCDSVNLESAKDSSSSPFISAWMVGNSLDSASNSATIRQHSGNAYRQITLDLTVAALTSDTNPFVSSSSGSSTGSGSSGSSGNSTDSGSGSSTSGDSGSSSGSADGSGGATVVGIGISPYTQNAYRKAHGIILGLTVAVLFPLGAIVMRLGGSALLHGVLQLFSLCALMAGFGVGVKLGDFSNQLYNTTHTIFGTVIFGLFLIQPVLGLMHHLQYRKSLARKPVSHIHIWYGRIIMLLGIINGGLGLKLSNNTMGGKIAYGVVSGVVGVAYVVLVVLKRKGKGSGSRGADADGVTDRRESKKGLWGRREKVRDGSS